MPTMPGDVSLSQDAQPAYGSIEKLFYRYQELRDLEGRKNELIKVDTKHPALHITHLASPT